MGDFREIGDNLNEGASLSDFGSISSTFQIFLNISEKFNKFGL